VLHLYSLAGLVIACAAVAGAAIPLSGHELIFNDSPSVPRGFYWIEVGAAPRTRGEYVVFAPPAAAAALIYGRGWLPVSMPLLKPVAGVEGDRYCVKDRRFTVDDVEVGPVFLLDSAGRWLPQIRGCRRVGAGEFLPASSYIERSFDGRYMGAVPMANVVGTGRALLTF
jgi:conjugative transfer signal peptidase TraF